MTGTIKLAAVGDIMLGDHPVCFGHGIRSEARRRGLNTLLKEVTPALRMHDIFFGNLECVLSHFDHDEKNLASSELRGDPSNAKLLNFCTHNILSIANNHMLQHGNSAFEDTCQLLKNNNIQPIGIWTSGLSNVATIEKNGVKLAFMGYSFRPENFCNDNSCYAHAKPEIVAEQILAFKRKNPSHLIVLSLHWGEEYLHIPSPSQVELARRFIDSGATLILGHHPHVLQGIETYNDGLIAYSLGNFLFDSWQLPTRETAILSCELSPLGVTNVEIIPAFIDRRYVVSLSSPKALEIPNKISRYTKDILPMGDHADRSESEYQQLAESTYFRYRIQCYIYFLTHIWKYKPQVIFHSLFRATLRRLGVG